MSKALDLGFDTPRGLSAEVICANLTVLLSEGHSVNFIGLPTTKACTIEVRDAGGALVTTTVCRLSYLSDGMTEVYSQVPEKTQC